MAQKSKFSLEVKYDNLLSYSKFIFSLIADKLMIVKIQIYWKNRNFFLFDTRDDDMSKTDLFMRSKKRSKLLENSRLLNSNISYCFYADQIWSFEVQIT